MDPMTIEPINDAQIFALQQVAADLRRLLSLVETTLPAPEMQVPVIEIEQ
jgi:hypothetical protein